MMRAGFPDPYEGMSADELDRHFSGLISEGRRRQRAVSIRFPEELLEELRQLADQVGVPYQTLIKRLLEQDVARLKARPLTVGRGRSVRGAASRGVTIKKTPAVSPARSSQAKAASTKRTTRRPRTVA